MTALQLLHAPSLTAEDRAMILLEYLNTPNTKFFFHEGMTGPVIELVTGDRYRFDSWDEYDWLVQRDYAAVDDEDAAVIGPTWAGVKALRKWQRRHGR